MTPAAVQRTALKKHGRTNARSVFCRKALDAANIGLLHEDPLLSQALRNPGDEPFWQ